MSGTYIAYIVLSECVTILYLKEAGLSRGGWCSSKREENSFWLPHLPVHDLRHSSGLSRRTGGTIWPHVGETGISRPPAASTTQRVRFEESFSSVAGSSQDADSWDGWTLGVQGVGGLSLWYWNGPEGLFHSGSCHSWT